MSNLLADRDVRQAGAGFFLTGILMGVLGPLMVVWRYQLDKDPREVGFHFFAFDAALLFGGLSYQWWNRLFTGKAFSITSCLLASAAFIGMAFVPPSWQIAGRIAGVIALGAATGGLLAPLLHFIRPSYERHAASTINLSGSAFGIGSLLVTVSLGLGTRVSAPWQVLLLAPIPLIVLAFIARIPFPSAAVHPPKVSAIRDAIRDFRSLTAVLFSLLLFFQFGNEWALAGWLPLFLVRRLGMSPESAIFTLALYFTALIGGRFVSQSLLRKVSYTKLLFGSITVEMLGYLLVSLTVSPIGAALATVVLGLGFAPIYALVAEKMGRRFDYQPGFFNSLFSLAVVGAILVPWLLGFVGYYFGMQYVLIVPAFCSVAVLLLMLLITLEAKLMSSDKDRDGKPSEKAMATGAGQNK
jgi:MFS family permease